MEIITQSAKETQKLGQKIAAQLKPGDVLALYGELGSGKTTFIQGLAQGLEIRKRVISPTFVFIREYPLPKRKGLGTFHHIDLYRLDNENEAQGLGLKETFSDKKGISVIEWADRIKKTLPKKRIDLFFEYLDENKRKIKIKGLKES